MVRGACDCPTLGLGGMGPPTLLQITPPRPPAPNGPSWTCPPPAKPLPDPPPPPQGASSQRLGGGGVVGVQTQGAALPGR